MESERGETTRAGEESQRVTRGGEGRRREAAGRGRAARLGATASSDRGSMREEDVEVALKVSRHAPL